MTKIAEDGRLLLRLKAGDLGALGEIYDHHNANIFRTALAITCNHITAEKILKDCFLNLNRNIQSIEPSQSFQSWLLRETVNLAYTWGKQRVHWPITLDWPDQRAEVPSPNSLNTSGGNFQGELINAIAGLEIHQRVVVVLHYYNLLSIDEIADILECQPGTVKSRLHYGRENLRRQLNTSNIASPELRGGLRVDIQKLFLRNREI